MEIKWNTNYSVHVSELDQQHQHLITLIRELEAASQKANFKETLNHVCDEMMEFVMIHFYTEEMYMESAGYEQLEIHKALHQSLAQDVNERINEMIGRETTALDLIKLHNFLIDMVNTHILEEDQKYVESLKEMHDI